MANTYKLWTEDDVRLLRSMAVYFPAPHMARVLGRSVSSVKAKLLQLGIKLRLRGYVRASIPSDWTEKELATLRSGAGKLTAIELSKKLPRRSVRAIRLKAARLGLTLFKTPWAEAEMDKLLELRRQGLSYPQIGAQLGRPGEACRARYRYLTGV